jgi:hypothetical protein
MIDFIDTVSVLQNISSYAQVTSDDNPFKLSLPSYVAHNRDVVLHLEITAENWQDSYETDLIITAENGYQLYGYYDSLLYLGANKLYTITDNFRCDSLVLAPGVNLKINDDVVFDVLYYLKALGKPDSLISLERFPGSEYDGLVDNFSYRYCYFDNLKKEVWGTFDNVYFHQTSINESFRKHDRCVVTANSSWPPLKTPE